MANELAIFPYEGTEVRTITKDGEPWFAGKDVCAVFGDTNHNRSLSRVLDADKAAFSIETAGGKQNVIFVNETGLYDLLFSMQPQRANHEGVRNAYPLEVQQRIEKLAVFRRWVTHEVLPSIRKVGMYATPATAEKLLSDPDFLIEALTELKTIRAKNAALTETVNVQNRQIAEMTPKASYCDVVLNCKDALTITAIAKDYGKSGLWMNEYLHSLGVQFKQSNIWMLYQKYAGRGYTRTRTHSYSGNDGTDHSKVHTYWTQKGRLFIYELLKSNGWLPLIERRDSAEGDNGQTE
jgi:prophage antirepressor-like protein